MESQIITTSLESDQKNPTLQVVADQPAVDLDDDRFVITDKPGSDDGWIEDSDEEVPALRKLSDVEHENFDDVDNDSEFHYDESFLSTADDCAEEFLGLNSADEIANGTESTPYTDVYSSTQRSAPTSVGKASVVQNQSFAVNSCQDRVEVTASGEDSDKTASADETANAEEGKGEVMFYGDKFSKRETTSQTQQIKTLVGKQGHEAKVKEGIDDSIESKQYCTMKLGRKETRGSSMLDELLSFPESKRAVLPVSALPTRGVKKARRRKTGGKVAFAFDVKDRSNRLRQTKVSTPKEMACESETQKPGEEELTTNPNLIPPMPTSQMCTSSRSEPTRCSTPSTTSITSSASQCSIKPRTVPLKVDVKGIYPKDGILLTNMSTPSSASSITRAESSVGREGLAGESVDCKGLDTTRINDVIRKNSELKTTTSESLPETSNQKTYLFKVQAGSKAGKADDSKTSSLFSGDEESRKKRYTSVDEYVKDLKLMMKEKGIKNMVLQGPKQVINDVTKRLNDSDKKKVLFRLGVPQTPAQEGISILRPLSKVKKPAPASCATPSLIDSQMNKPPLKLDPSNTGNVSKVIKSAPASCATPSLIDSQMNKPPLKLDPSNTGNVSKVKKSAPASCATPSLIDLQMNKPPLKLDPSNTDNVSKVKKSAPASCATPSLIDSQMNKPPLKLDPSNTGNVSKVKKSAPASCATPSLIDSQMNKPPLKLDPSDTANVSEESAAKDDKPSEFSIPAKCASFTPEVITVKYPTPVSVGNIADEAQSLPATTSNVFKALSILKLGQPDEDPAVPLSAPISSARPTDHAIEGIIKARMDTNNPTAGNTVIDSLGTVIPSRLTHAPPSTDQTASTQQTQNSTLEKTKTVTAGCYKPLAAKVASNAGEGETRITRSKSRAATETKRKSVTDLDIAMAPPLKLGDKTSAVVGDQDGMLRFRAPSQSSPSSMLPFVMNTSDKTDGTLVGPCVSFVGLPRLPRTSAPLLLPKRTNLVRYVVLGPDGQRKILQVPGGIPVLVSKALSGQTPLIHCNSNLSIGAYTDNSVLGDLSATKEVVDVRTEVLPSGAKVKIVRTRTKSSPEHVERNVRTDPKKIVILGANESPNSGKNIVSQHDGSFVYTQKSTTAINQLENNPTEIARDHDKTIANIARDHNETIAKQVSRSSEPCDGQEGTCESTENIGVNSPSPRRSRRERKVTRPYSPPPQKRRKCTSSPSSSDFDVSSAEIICSSQQPSPKPSASAVVVLKKDIELPHLVRLSGNTTVECIKEEDGQQDTRTPKKVLKIRIKSEPLSDDDEPMNPAEPSPNLAENKTIKPEPDTDSDSTDIPTDPEDTDDESCHPSDKPTGLLADARPADGTGELPKISDSEYLSRAEKMRLLKQRIQEQESMLENIQRQRQQQVMQRQNNPDLEDLF
eukprot:XP_003723757.1 PREDICTED: uncharacterized protein LOC100889696 isoform X1 [Strongylocentrotus purpuratus]